MNQEKLVSKDCYSTSDLGLATTISLWFPVDSINRQNPQKAIFIFKQNVKLNELLESYWTRELRVEPQAYFNQLKAIKARLYSEQ